MFHLSKEDNIYKGSGTGHTLTDSNLAPVELTNLQSQDNGQSTIKMEN